MGRAELSSNSPVGKPGSTSSGRLETAALADSSAAASSGILSQKHPGGCSWIPDYQKLQGNKLLFKFGIICYTAIDNKGLNPLFSLKSTYSSRSQLRFFFFLEAFPNSL